MKLMKCINNHFYDGDIYNVCPHCSEAAQNPITERLPKQTKVQGNIEDTYASEGLWATSEHYSDTSSIEVEMKSSTNDLQAEINELNVTERLLGSERQVQSWERDTGKFKQLDRHTSSSDEGVTVRHFVQAAGSKEPLVGWLVGLNGEVYGEGFPLIAGKNYIGRGSDMDVVIRGDQTVSRSKHAIVIFDPKGKQFLVQPGETKELFYLNDKVVLDTQTMNNGCELLIGATRLRFVALCGEDFSWETYA